MTSHTADDVRELSGGLLLMGATTHYPEEGPVREVRVAPFRIDVRQVTNAQFAAFVEETGYVTVAERPVELPGHGPRAPGSLVFTPTAGPVDLGDWRQWWRWVEGACWSAPQGPGSDVEDRADHPVVHVSHHDALAYAQWAGRRLPTEAEWEYAARGGLVQATYSWGEDDPDPTHLRANTWQGAFPYLNTGAAGWVGTSPVGSFEPNGFGLFDMTGNVWEWTSSRWTDNHAAPACGCAPVADDGHEESYVLKGGSHLCAPEYCLRYRPAARSRQSADSATTHIGFRCAG